MTIEAQQVITGRVTDAVEGAPLAGAYIFISNTTIRTVSDDQEIIRLLFKERGFMKL